MTKVQPNGSVCLSQPEKSPQATLTSDPSQTFGPQTSRAIPSATSSRGSEVGPTPSSSPVGPLTSPSGPEAAPANPLVRRVSNSGPPTPATSGRCSTSSSRSADLTLCLASRLKERLGKGGSMEYAETWREKVTPAGLRYWAHTASGHRTSGSDSTGWPTPTVGNATGSQMAKDASPTGRRPDGSKATVSLNAVAQLAGWATPTTRDHKDTGDMSQSMTRADGKPRNDTVPRQAFGATSISSPAQTGKRGALNPAFSRWLMGYPAAWDSCGATAMQSSRKSPRSSSVPISTQSEDLL